MTDREALDGLKDDLQKAERTLTQLEMNRDQAAKETTVLEQQLRDLGIDPDGDVDEQIMAKEEEARVLIGSAGSVLAGIQSQLAGE